MISYTFETDFLHFWDWFPTLLRLISYTFETDLLYYWDWFPTLLRLISYTFETDFLHFWDWFPTPLRLISYTTFQYPNIGSSALQCLVHVREIFRLPHHCLDVGYSCNIVKAGVKHQSINQLNMEECQRVDKLLYMSNEKFDWFG
jgi:hypothetical protein